MKISVIIPIYNVGQYLRQTLDSVVNQTHQDIEIICINDGSTDDSLKIVEDYASKDQRIKIINQENAGLYISRQNGIRTASGDYILFLDGDDWLDIDTCEKIAAMAKDTHADIIQYGLQVESPDNNHPDVRWFDAWFNVSTKQIDGADEMLKRCYIDRAIPWNIATKAIRSEIAKEAITYQESFRINQLEDFLSCFFLFFLSAKWVRLDGKLYHYRYGLGMSTKKVITIDDFEKNLQYFKGLQSIQHFVANRKVSPIVQEVAMEVMPQYVMNDAFHFIFQRLDKNTDNRLWADALTNALGREATIYALAAKLTQCHAEQARLMESESQARRKKKKYLHLFRDMCIVSGLLLIALIALIVLF